MMRLAIGSAVSKAERAHVAQLDRIDDLLGELALQQVVALLADADDLHRLAGGDQRLRAITRETRDRRVERAAQATFGGEDDEQVHVVLARAGEKRRSAGARDARGDARQHRAHALGIGTGRLGRRLGAAELRRRDHLHGLGDLLRRLHRGDAVAQVLQRRHGSPLPLRSGGDQAKDLANASTTSFSFFAVSSERSLEVRMASRTSAWLVFSVESRPSWKARTRLTGSGSR